MDPLLCVSFLRSTILSVPCGFGHLLGKSMTLVYDGFLCFCHFPITVFRVCIDS